MSEDAVVRELVEEFAPDLESERLLDLIIRRKRKTLEPGMDWRDGRIWLTIPSTVPDTRKVGRGKDAHDEDYDRDLVLLINDRGLIREYNKETVNSLGYEFPQVFYIGEKPRWDVDDMWDYLKYKEPMAGADVFAELKSIWLEYIEYGDPIYYDLMPLYVMASYVFKIFNSIGYIHFNGHAGSGKSQNLKLMRAFGLNSVYTSNTSLSALFRSTAAYPGLLALDEVEGFNGDDGYELRKLVLNGYNKGGSVRRAERLSADQPFVPITYPVYSPKVLASINPQDHTLTTRCLVVPMTASLRRIPPFDVEDDKWQKVRDKLYRWTLSNGALVAQAQKDWNTTKRHQEVPDILNRQWEIASVFYSLADGIGRGDLVPKMNEFFNAYFKEAAELMADTDKINITLRTLPTVLRLRAPAYGDWYYSLKDVHELVLQHVQTDEEDRWKTQTISRHLRASGFKTTKQGKDGLLFRLEPDKVKDKLQRKLLEPFEDDEDWYELAHVAQRQTPANLDWLNEYSEAQ